MSVHGRGAPIAEYVARCGQKCYVLPVATACNARCVYCATRVYAPRARREFADVRGFPELAERLIGAGVRVFEVTGGGEPTLHPSLSKALRALREHAVTPRIKLYTNGSRRVSYVGVDELNISRAALIDDINGRIMRFKGPEADLAEIVDRSRRDGVTTIRLSVPVIAGGVESPSDAVNFVSGLPAGIDCVVFRPLYPATPHREMLAPADAGDDWERFVATYRPASGRPVLEFDALGCRRSSQLIWSSDNELFRDWSLSNRAPSL